MFAIARAASAAMEWDTLIKNYWIRLKGFYAVGRFTANISENSKQADCERLSGQRREVQNRPSPLDQLSSDPKYFWDNFREK